MNIARTKQIFKLLMTLSFASIGIVSTSSLSISEPSTVNNSRLEDISRDRQRLVGQEVTVRGPIENIQGDGIFEMKDEDLFGLIDDETIAVINQTGSPLPVRPNDDIEIQVTGVVAPMEKAAIKRNFGLNLPVEIVEEYESRAVIYAQSIAISPSPDEILDEPTDYYGARVAIKGEIDLIADETVFTIEDGDLNDQIFGADDLLVISNGTTPIQQKEAIVTGFVRRHTITSLKATYPNLFLTSSLLNELDDLDKSFPVIDAEGVFYTPENE